VTLKWKYDNSTSYIVKWRIVYHETDKSQLSETITMAHSIKRDMKIGNLVPGRAYYIRLFAVTTGDVTSQTSAGIIATVGKNM